MLPPRVIRVLQLTVVALCLAALAMTPRGDPDFQVVLDFCQNILLQTQTDTAQCFEKPRGWKLDGDRAALLYLCCLGLFNDVTHNYLPFLGDDLVEFVAHQKTDRNMTRIARFIMSCKSDSHKISTQDFGLWYQTASCPS